MGFGECDGHFGGDERAVNLVLNVDLRVNADVESRRFNFEANGNR